MKPITPDSISKTKLKQWIAELTDYTPQQVEQVVEQLQDSYRAA